MPALKQGRNTTLAAHKTTIQKFINKLLWDEGGQAITEYILLLAIVVTLAVALMRAIIQGIDRGLVRIGSGLERILKTGRLAPSVWEN